LCDYLLILQLLSSIVGFACRYALGNFLFWHHCIFLNKYTLQLLKMLNNGYKIHLSI
jgi:hypothetical protein